MRLEGRTEETDSLLQQRELRVLYVLLSTLLLFSQGCLCSCMLATQEGGTVQSSH